MSEHSLQHEGRDSCQSQMAGRAVSHQMRCDVYINTLADPLKNMLEMALLHRQSLPSAEKYSAWKRATESQEIRVQMAQSLSTKGQTAFFAPLPHDPQRASFEVDVFDLDVDQFAEADQGIPEHVEDAEVAEPCEGVPVWYLQQLFHLFLREYRLEPALRANVLNPIHRVRAATVPDPFGNKELEEGLESANAVIDCVIGDTILHREDVPLYR